MKVFDSGLTTKNFVEAAGLTATEPLSTEVLTTSAGKVKITHDTSGVTEGTYGSAAAQAPMFGGTASVPYVQVNSTGHMTGAGTAALTIPATLAADSAPGLMSAAQVSQLATNTENIAANASAITAEIARAKAAESSLQTLFQFTSTSPTVAEATASNTALMIYVGKSDYMSANSAFELSGRLSNCGCYTAYGENKFMLDFNFYLCVSSTDGSVSSVNASSRIIEKYSSFTPVMKYVVYNGRVYIYCQLGTPSNANYWGSLAVVSNQGFNCSVLTTQAIATGGKTSFTALPALSMS